MVSTLSCFVLYPKRENKIKEGQIWKKNKKEPVTVSVCLEASLGMLNGNLRLILRLAANLFRDLDLIQVGRQIVVNIFKKTLLIFFNL